MFIICENGNAVNLDQVAKIEAAKDGAVVALGSGIVEVLAEMGTHDRAQQFIAELLTLRASENEPKVGWMQAEYVKTFVRANEQMTDFQEATQLQYRDALERHNREDCSK